MLAWVSLIVIVKPFGLQPISLYSFILIFIGYVGTPDDGPSLYTIQFPLASAVRFVPSQLPVLILQNAVGVTSAYPAGQDELELELDVDELELELLPQFTLISIFRIELTSPGPVVE